MVKLTIHRGTHQIGGCCTEINCDGERILIDLGANLPDSDAPIQDDELIAKIFDRRPAAGLLFTHPHGDHYGLYKKVPASVPMYIGPMAKEILKVLISRLDCISEEKGLPVIERMRTYQAGQELRAFQNIRVLPLYIDHSAPDAYMFYIQAAGKKILFSGDFRDHGIVGEKERLWRTLEKFVPRGIDLLITEGTMLSRRSETASNPVQTEEQLGQRAEELFRQHKYNFVLVSSTNLDSIMEFYHHTPRGAQFACDAYQAEVMLTAMKGMEAKDTFLRYQCAARQPVIRVLNGERLSQLGAALKNPVGVEPANSSVAGVLPGDGAAGQDAGDPPCRPFGDLHQRGNRGGQFPAGAQGADASPGRADPVCGRGHDRCILGARKARQDYPRRGNSLGPPLPVHGRQAPAPGDGNRREKNACHIHAGATRGLGALGRGNDSETGGIRTPKE